MLYGVSVFWFRITNAARLHIFGAKNNTESEPMNSEEIVNQLRDLKPYLAHTYHIDTVGLFGSYARGDFDENSDIDILVGYSQITALWDRFDTIDDLEKIFHKRVDLANKKNLKRFIRERVLREVIEI